MKPTAEMEKVAADLIGGPGPLNREIRAMVAQALADEHERAMGRAFLEAASDLDAESEVSGHSLWSADALHRMARVLRRKAAIRAEAKGEDVDAKRGEGR